jgi:ABC-type multidrug transport system fused ATPase/permease subunit
LKKLNLELLEDKFNALAGFTGSGKSTVIQLLLKHYSPSSGVILIDEIDLVNINTPYWLDRIGIVTQEPVLFDGTIRENIQVGKPNATD